MGIIALSLFGNAVFSSQTRRDNFFFDALFEFATLARNARATLNDFLIEEGELYRVDNEFTNETGYKDIQNNTDHTIRGLKLRLGKDGTQPSPSWRVIVGIFDFGDSLEHAALAISPEMTIEHVWLIDKEYAGRRNKVGVGLYLHGFALLEDMSIIFSFDQSYDAYRMDHCANPIWTSDYDLHHAISPAEEEKYVWSLDGANFVKIATETGDAVNFIRLDDVVKANSETSVFDIRRQDLTDPTSNVRDEPVNYLTDPLHYNDIVALPVDITHMYPDFDAGDLLISARSLNMIVVIDPETLKVKWKMIGATKRQHDPDWGSDGKITVFDNRMTLDYSRILSIDPTTNKVETLFDGEKVNFFSRARGKHQISDDGSILITSSQQGYVFEVDKDGNRTFELLVTAPDYQDKIYVVSDAFKPTSANLTREKLATCSN